LQNFAPTGSNVLGPVQEYLNHRVDCAQARTLRSKISIRNVFNTKLTSLTTYDS
jgi:hypothetical protein